MKYFVEKNGIPVELVGVSRNSPAELEEFMAKFQFSHPVVCDKSGELYRRFKVKLEPFKIILKDGSVLFEEDAYDDFLVRREKVKKCLLEIASR
jgi:peroxiredoxin